MTVDHPTALEAREKMRWIAKQWPALTTALAGGRNNALTGINVTGSKTQPLIIDVFISDLMHEITENVARHYAAILIEETTWTPTTSHMPALLMEVAERYGHFLSDDDLALGFCDDADDYKERVRKALTRPAPPTYIGPCQVNNCEGELYLRPDRDAVRCPHCGTHTTHIDQRTYLAQEMSARLMTATELSKALKILDTPVPHSTIRNWVQRHELTEAVPDTGLYHLEEARNLAANHKPRRRQLTSAP